MSKIPLNPTILSSLNRHIMPASTLPDETVTPIAMDRRNRLLYNSIRLLFRLYPDSASRLLLYLVLHPKPHDLTYIDDLPEITRPITLPYKNSNLVGYEWGTGEKTVLLVHGWLGDVGRMLPLAQLLYESGFRVLAFDAPGHGLSVSLCTNMVEYSEALCHIVKTYTPLHAIVAHSYGASAIALMLNQHRPIGLQRLVMLSPMQNVIQQLNLFRESFNLPEILWDDLRIRLEQRIGQSLARCDIAEAVAQLDVAGLVVHDHHDQLIPVQSGRKIAQAWQNAKYIETKYLGHHGTIRNAAICTQVIEFLN